MPGESQELNGDTALTFEKLRKVALTFEDMDNNGFGTAGDVMPTFKELDDAATSTRVCIPLESMYCNPPTKSTSTATVKVHLVSANTSTSSDDSNFKPQPSERARNKSGGSTTTSSSDQPESDVQIRTPCKLAIITESHGEEISTLMSPNSASGTNATGQSGVQSALKAPNSPAKEIISVVMPHINPLYVRP